MIIGHNPGIAEFAERLLAITPVNPEFARYPTGATLVADFQIKDWSELTWGTGVVDDFIVPREMVI
jgi:phosphohistidine phosphatase